MSEKDDLDSKVREAQQLESTSGNVTSETEEFATNKSSKKDGDHLSLQSVALHMQAVKVQKKEGENKLRSILCICTIVIIVLQLVACDVFVIVYVYFHQSISDILISTWIGSNFVEIIGILWVIARSLFPFHDRKRDKSAEKH
ncbi:hypothetical protein [Gardnerella sp. KA00255]|uniref:hypothetical protein n=1 Tax=Gardnerella sp. KA00255 TaxID=2749073 RepID=UPI003BA98D73